MPGSASPDYYDTDLSAPVPLLDQLPEPTTFWGGAAARAGGRQALPTAAGVAAYPTGAAAGGVVGAAIGGPFAEITGPIGAVVGGLLTSAGTGAAVEYGQDQALVELPHVAEFLGQDEKTRAADLAAHPRAVMFGSLAPQLMFMRPGWNGVRAAAAGGAIAGGVEAGSEYAHSGTIDPGTVAAQTLLGATLGKNTRLGDLAMSPANRLVSMIATGPGATDARLGANQVVEQGAADLGVDEAAVAKHEVLLGEMYPNLTPATRRDLARAEVVAATAGSRATPDELAAHAVIASDAHVETTNPFIGPQAAQQHGDALAGHVQALVDGTAPPPIDAAVREPTPPLDGPSWFAAIEHVESRGNTMAVSPKGARGVMQLMPGTARDMAAELGLPYDEARLNSDPDYNRALGQHYATKLLNRYDGNQVLATAAYNGGPGRVDHWLQTIGDPRTGALSDAQWAERIPIAETRDYVRSAYAAAGHEMPSTPVLRPDIADQAAEFDAAPDLTAAERPPVADGQSTATQEPPPFGELPGASSAPSGEILDRLRSYIRDREGPLNADAVGQQLQIDPDQAYRALSALASSRDSGMIMGSNGALRRQAVRRGPVDVLTFLADNGGIRDDEGHDLVQSRNLQQFVPGAGNLIRKTGMSIDRAGELLHEAGYFPVERPTEDDVLQLIEHANSEKLYRPEDAVGVAARAAQAADDEQRDNAIFQVHGAVDQAGFDFSDGEVDQAVDLMAHGLTPEDATLAIAQRSSLDLLSHFEALTEDPIHANDELDAGPEYPGQRLARENDGGPAARDRRSPRGPGDQGELGAPSREPAGAPRARGGESTELTRALPAPALHAFDQPNGEGAKAQADSIEHDLRMLVDPAIAERQRQQAELGAAAPLRKPVEQDGTIGLALFDRADQPQFRLSDEGEPTTIKTVLDEIDAERKAIDELRGCIKPGGGA